MPGLRTEFSIIVVDDDLDDQFLIRDAFSRLKAEIKITTAGNGAELLDILNHKTQSVPVYPDFILLDVNMPIVDGYEALRRLKKDPLLKAIPVFMLSTTMLPEKLQEAKNSGALEYFTKPTNMVGYKDILQQIFSHF